MRDTLQAYAELWYAEQSVVINASARVSDVLDPLQHVGVAPHHERGPRAHPPARLLGCIGYPDRSSASRPAGIPDELAHRVSP